MPVHLVTRAPTGPACLLSHSLQHAALDGPAFADPRELDHRGKACIVRYVVAAQSSLDSW